MQKRAFTLLVAHLSAQQFAFLPKSKLLFTCGHWDHSLRITHAETGNLVQSVRQHKDVTTCLALAKDFGQCWLVTGSRDCTLMVWDVDIDQSRPLKTQPQYILYGHDDSITCVAINPELDIVVSGSDDGTVIIHNLREGSYLCSIAVSKGLSSTNQKELSRSTNCSPCCLHPVGGGVQSPQRQKISWVGISKEAFIITYSADKQTLSTFALNGILISSREVSGTLYALILSEDGKVLISGGTSCLVVLRWVSW